jgi:hypothetical protein
MEPEGVYHNGSNTIGGKLDVNNLKRSVGMLRENDDLRELSHP